MTAKIRASSGCPSCHRRHVVDVHEVLEAKPTGTYSIAGAWPKLVAVSTWQYTCTNCGATGGATAPNLPPGLPVAVCGHTIVTDHYPGDDHLEQNCPGCCPACRRTRDAERERRS
jgi:hypothetical protein